MRRLISTLLCGALILGLLAGAALAAPFTDSGDIGPDYREAVCVMAGMGILSGRSQGEGGAAFEPQGAVTRAEACKIICCMLLGRDTAESLPAGGAPFADVPEGHWAAPYIRWCLNAGVVSGAGEGGDGVWFQPGRSILGLELGKMLLTALGYGALGEYDGADWAAAVTRDCLRLDIFAGDGAALISDAITRQQTSLAALNAMTLTEAVALTDGEYAPRGWTLGGKYYGYSAGNTARGLMVTAVAGDGAGGLRGTIGGYTFAAASREQAGRLYDVYYTDGGDVLYMDPVGSVEDYDPLAAYSAPGGVAVFYNCALISTGTPLSELDTAPGPGVTRTAVLDSDGNLAAVRTLRWELDAVTVTYNEAEGRVYRAVSAAHGVLFARDMDGSVTRPDVSDGGFADLTSGGRRVVKLLWYGGDSRCAVLPADTVTGVLERADAASGAVTLGGGSYYRAGADGGSSGLDAGGIDFSRLTPGEAYTLTLDLSGRLLAVSAARGDCAGYSLALVAACNTDTLSRWDESAGGYVTGYDYSAQIAFADGRFGTWPLATLDGLPVLSEAEAAAAESGTEYFPGGSLALSMSWVLARIGDGGEADILALGTPEALMKYASGRYDALGPSTLRAADMRPDVITLADREYIDSMTSFMYLANPARRADAATNPFSVTYLRGAHAASAGAGEYGGETYTCVSRWNGAADISTVAAAALPYAYRPPVTPGLEEKFYVVSCEGQVYGGYEYTAYNAATGERVSLLLTAPPEKFGSGYGEDGKLISVAPTSGPAYAVASVESFAGYDKLLSPPGYFTLSGVSYLHAGGADLRLAENAVFINLDRASPVTDLSGLANGDCVDYTTNSNAQIAVVFLIVDKSAH